MPRILLHPKFISMQFLTEQCLASRGKIEHHCWTIVSEIKQWNDNGRIPRQHGPDSPRRSKCIRVQCSLWRSAYQWLQFHTGSGEWWCSHHGLRYNRGANLWFVVALDTFQAIDHKYKVFMALCPHRPSQHSRPVSNHDHPWSHSCSHSSDFHYCIAAIYKALDEANPELAPPSRNLYILALANDKDSFLRDSNNSSGNLKSQSVGPITSYAKVITCSLNVSEITVTINGLGCVVNDTILQAEPRNHPWEPQQPLPSRGNPYEDSFSAFFGSVAARNMSSLAFGGDLQFSLLELLGAKLLNEDPRLSQLENILAQVTDVSYHALSVHYGSNITECVIFLLSFRLMITGPSTNAVPVRWSRRDGILLLHGSNFKHLCFEQDSTCLVLSYY